MSSYSDNDKIIRQKAKRNQKLREKYAALSPEEKELCRLKQREAYQKRKAKKIPTHLFDEKETSTAVTVQLCQEFELPLHTVQQADSCVQLLNLTTLIY